MKNKVWYEEIPNQGVLCMVDNDPKWIILALSYNKETKSILTADKCGGFLLDAVKPLTPQEWLDCAPWNYNMDNADRSKRLILNYKGKIIINAFYGINGWESGGVSYNEADAWLPLPDNK